MLAPLLAAIADTAAWLKAAGVEGAVIGGVAAAIRGIPRVTKDVDWVIAVDDGKLPALLKAARAFGIRPRINDALVFAKTTRVLLLRHQGTRIDIDVSLAMLSFETEVIQRAAMERVGKVTFPLATAEDIVIMKAIALRPRDIVDIEGIVSSTIGLDLSRIRRVVKELSDALEGDDYAAQLEKLLARTRPMRGRPKAAARVAFAKKRQSKRPRRRRARSSAGVSGRRSR